MHFLNPTARCLYSNPLAIIRVGIVIQRQARALPCGNSALDVSEDEDEKYISTNSPDFQTTKAGESPALALMILRPSSTTVVAVEPQV